MHLPSQNIWQHIVDEVLHTLMLGGTLQKKLEGFQIPAVIFNQTLNCRRHGESSLSGTGANVFTSGTIIMNQFNSTHRVDRAHSQYLTIQQENELHSLGDVGGV